MTTVSPYKSSVLILNTFQPSHVPVLTDLNGNVNMNLTFEIENDAYVYNSCGVQFKGSFFIYGSLEGDRRQIAKVVDCSLKRIDTLSFPFVEGACSANSNQVILCFHYFGDGKTCHTSNEPTGPFNSIPKSTEVHLQIRSAANESKQIYLLPKNSISDIMLTCGSGYYPNGHNKCEIYKINENKWDSITSYPSV